ncbi:MAG: DNA polymerase III subunit gamma and tau, partial [Microlunatus sp.]
PAAPGPAAPGPVGRVPAERTSAEPTDTSGPALARAAVRSPAPDAAVQTPVIQAPASQPPGAQPVAPQPTGRQQLTLTDVRRLWPEVLEEVKGRRRFTWILLSQNAQVADVRDGVLVLAMAGIGPRDSFAKGGSENILREALNDALGVDLRIETIVDPSVSAGGRGGPGPSGPGASGPGPSGPVAGRRGGPVPAVAGAPPRATRSEESATGGGAPAEGSPAGSGPASWAPASAPPDNSAARSDVGGAGREQARQSIRPTRQSPSGAGGEVEDLRDEAVSVDDSDIEEFEESHTELLARQLGAQIIGEEPHDV